MLVARSWWLAVSLTLGCRATAFACEGAQDCAAAGDAGVCQPDGWCSFPTDECPSGQRYGEHAGDGLAGTCVDDGGTTTSATTSDETTKTTSIDTTLTETSPTETSRGTDAETTITESSTVADTSASDSMTDATAEETATVNVCGDGIVADDEQCDLGDENGGGGPCREDCVLNVCGDGYLGEGEQCEPDLVDSCNADCSFVSCGDGEIDPGEECDPKAPMPDSCEMYGYIAGELGCTSDCTITTNMCDGCGDDGCQFPPCNDACPHAEHCVSYLDGEVCTASCNGDADCTSDLPGVFCENNECVLPCEFQDDCPFMMMACFNGQCAYAMDP